jgi:hypothetical protein
LHAHGSSISVQASALSRGLVDRHISILPVLLENPTGVVSARLISATSFEHIAANSGAAAAPAAAAQ